MACHIHMSRVICHVSCVTCHMSCVTCFFCCCFFWQSGEAHWWRVCYQHGLPLLVFFIHHLLTVDRIYTFHLNDAFQALCATFATYEVSAVCSVHRSECTRPPQCQSGAIFCHLNDHCVVFKVLGNFDKKWPEDIKNTLQILHLEPH